MSKDSKATAAGLHVRKEGSGFAVVDGEEILDLFETEPEAKHFLDTEQRHRSEADARKADAATRQAEAGKTVKLVVPEGTGSIGGPSGKTYVAAKDGTVSVRGDDVPALINLGLKPAE